MKLLNKKNKKKNNWTLYIILLGIISVKIVLNFKAITTEYYNNLNGGQQIIFCLKRIVEELQNEIGEYLENSKINSWKFIWDSLKIVSIVFLYFLGKKIQNMRPKKNPKALLMDKQVYLLATEINEKVKSINNDKLEEIKKEVERITIRLKNESDFGYGSDEIIHYEEDIINSLREIQYAVSQLSKKDLDSAMINKILNKCVAIQEKLNIRSELKKDYLKRKRK